MKNKLICPNCRTKLKKFECVGCKKKFKLVNGIPMLIPELTSFKSAEKEFYSTEFAKSTSFDYVENEYKEDCWGLLRHFDVLQNTQEKILELGAGSGQYGLILKKRGFANVIVTDIAASGLISALNYAKQNKLSYKDSFYAVDAENLPFENNSFDLVFIVAALHHLENIPKAISEIKRCLKPNGKVIIAVEPNRWYFRIIRPIGNLLGLRRIQNEESSVADEKTKGFTIKELEIYLTDFKIIEKQKIWYLTGIIYYLPTLAKRAFNLNLQLPNSLRKITNKTDRIIEKMPIINRYSFHITIIAEKK